MADKPYSRTYQGNRKHAEKYLSKLAEIRLRMPPEQKEMITAAATAAGESVNRYILTATQTRMENEKQKP